MEDEWLAWAKQLQAISATGLSFTESPYDSDRYDQIDSIARRMLAALSTTRPATIDDLAYDAGGYPTPRVDVRAAVIRHHEILLVRERLDGRWTLPGGFADVGLSGAENATKEVLEEAGIRVSPQRLYCIRHKAKHGYLQDIRDFYKLFYLCEPEDDAQPTPGMETIDAGFFAREKLPPLSLGRTIAEDIDLALAAHREPTMRTVFD